MEKESSYRFYRNLQVGVKRLLKFLEQNYGFCGNSFFPASESQLGFAGREEGIAAKSVVLLKKFE